MKGKCGSALPACISVHHTHAWRLEEGVGYYESGATNDGNPPCARWE